MSGTLDGVAPARACAYAVIRRVFEQGAYADRAFTAEAKARSLSPRDRALAMRLAYGVVQRRATLDHVIKQLANRSLRRLDRQVLTALRLGLLQLLFLDGIAEHAAVNESVELARAGGSRGGGLVNAILRRATREGAGLLAELDDETPDRAALLHSVPEWLAQLWWDQLGPEQARALLRTVNEPPESALRVNTLIADADTVARQLPVPTRAVPPDGLVLEGPFDLEGSELFAAGAVIGQSRGSMLVARMLAPEPGERVLDLCAAPGAKTTQIAAMLAGRGTVVAVERHRGRAAALRRTCDRMRAGIVTVEVGDAAEPRGKEQFERVLADPPCSGLGTVQSRPDLRWRASPDQIAELALLQRRVLDAAAAATAPGGTLVYSVCTISRAESDAVIDAFIAREDDFSVEQQLRTFPHLDGTDGFFIARLRRRAATRLTTLRRE